MNARTSRWRRLFDAPTLANDYSIDTFELQSMVDWLYACQRAGVLSEAETGLPLSQIGSREFLIKLLHAIAYREGFGAILAEGMVRAAEKISPVARSLYGYAVAPDRHGRSGASPGRSWPMP